MPKAAKQAGGVIKEMDLTKIGQELLAWSSRTESAVTS
jgi:chemotaxis response regulator CheB